MTSEDRMHRIDVLLSHVWMVRAFLKHSEEAEEEEDLCTVHRALYDFALALGKPWRENDAEAYLKLARKKLGKLKKATADFIQLQPEISTHTNFQMSATSLRAAVYKIADVLKSA